MFNGTARASAALIALVAWIGLAVQFEVSFRNIGSIAATLSALLAYFTITTNLLVALLFTAIAARRLAFDFAWILAGTVLSILLVGVIYALLLARLYNLSGGAAFANLVLHQMTPALVPLFWLAFAPKGRLSLRDPVLWGVYPVAYLFYALARGAFSGKYPYPFINVARLGWPRTGLNAGFIALGFLIVGWALVYLDRRLPRAPGCFRGGSSPDGGAFAADRERVKERPSRRKA